MDDLTTVRAVFAAYQAQDLAATDALLAEAFVFTSPQDDHLDKATYLARCFPTAQRFVRQDLLQVTQLPGGQVFVLYECELVDGGVFRNAEVITLAEGKLVETQVFFGAVLGPPPR